MSFASGARFLRSRVGRGVAVVSAVGLLSASLIAFSPVLAAGAGYSAIYDDKADCGAGKSSQYTTEGYAVFSRDGDDLTINYNLVGAQSNQTFYVELWTNPDCNNFADLGTITTNGSGNGSDTFVTSVTGYTKFFAFAHTTGNTYVNETRTKTLH